MNKQQLRFFCDYGGCCLWGSDGGINHQTLPISNALKDEIETLLIEFDSQINWSCPLSSNWWTPEQDADFNQKSHLVCEKLQLELASNYEIRDLTELVFKEHKL
ncbi:MAG: hypothetical protein FWB96_06580 [Defluviitaleaceae bacterium]|nr:hypothetical protein [Defluviitaleaceae bacterium]MCL2263332.1 hypothetical protein [Defluviitaleaceae bacterium]